MRNSTGFGYALWDIAQQKKSWEDKDVAICQEVLEKAGRSWDQARELVAAEAHLQIMEC
jgi:hypothetical protein